MTRKKFGNVEIQIMECSNNNTISNEEKNRRFKYIEKMKNIKDPALGGQVQDMFFYYDLVVHTENKALLLFVTLNVKV